MSASDFLHGVASSRILLVRALLTEVCCRRASYGVSLAFLRGKDLPKVLDLDRASAHRGVLVSKILIVVSVVGILMVGLMGSLMLVIDFTTVIGRRNGILFVPINDLNVARSVLLVRMGHRLSAVNGHLCSAAGIDLTHSERLVGAVQARRTDDQRVLLACVHQAYIPVVDFGFTVFLVNLRCSSMFWSWTMHRPCSRCSTEKR